MLGNPAPLIGPIEAACPPWEPEVGPCPQSSPRCTLLGPQPWLVISFNEENLIY